MNFDFVTKPALRFAGRTALKLQKHAPIILTTTGIAGMVTSTVLASRATLNLEPIVEELKIDIDNANELMEVSEDDEYSSRDHAKDLTYAYFKGIGRIAKLYSPAFIIGAASIGSILGGHFVLQKRNLGLVAAYAALESTFNDYRAKVVDEFGSDKDAEFKRGATYSIQESTEEVDGKEVTVKKANPNGMSQYARFFSELSSTNWQKIPEYNLLFLRSQQNYANDLLHARGHVFLNEVYDMLGIERSSAGSVVGWVLSDEGDNFIDFGIYSFTNPEAQRFVDGTEGTILLDFNVDGTIFDKI